MDRMAVARTVLNLYSNLEFICEIIDKEVNSATNIMAKTSNAYLGSMLQLYDSVSNVIYRKSMLVNLKIYLEQALSMLSEENAGILYLRYMDKFSTKQIAIFTDNTVRAIDKKLFEATKLLSINLNRVGLTDEKFKEILNSEKWINVLYNFFCGVKRELPSNCCEIKVTNGIVTHSTINKLTKREYRCM